MQKNKLLGKNNTLEGNACGTQSPTAENTNSEDLEDLVVEDCEVAVVKVKWDFHGFYHLANENFQLTKNQLTKNLS